MPYPDLLHPEPLPRQQAIADQYLHKRCSLKGRSGSVSVESPGVHKILFEPSKCLWWVWGLILNMISPLLLSCWGFSFTLECEVSFFGGIQYSPVNGCSATIGQVLYAVPFAFGLIYSIHFQTYLGPQFIPASLSFLQ